MNVKIYLGKEEESFIEDGNVLITFLNEPIYGDTISYTYYTNWPVTTSQTTMEIPFISIPYPYTNEQMASDFRSFVTGTTNNTNAEYEVGSTSVKLSMINGSPIIAVSINVNNNFNFPIFAKYEFTKSVSKETNFQDIDLYKDETINFTSKLSDIEKLSNIFTDFTNTFTVPASDHNNELFKHYYDVDIYNTFNANVRVIGYIEIDTFTLRYGKIQLEQCTLKNNKPESYKITFYGGLLQLSDLFGDDTINKLDYKKNMDTGVTDLEPTWNSLSQFSYEYTGPNFINSINLGTFKGGNIITPLISYTNRDWNYGSNNVLDISTTGGAILDNELRPAIRIAKILEAIETKYSISFTRDFFGKAVFNNLFMWMNAKTENILGQSTDMPISSTLASGFINAPIPGLNFGSMNIANNFIEIFSRRWTNFSAVEFKTEVYFNLYPSNPSAGYTAIILNEDGNVVGEYGGLSGNTTIPFILNAQFAMYAPEQELVRNKIRIVVIPDISFTMQMNVALKQTGKFASQLYTQTDCVTVTPPLVQMAVTVEIEDNIPKMKVIDFIQGLMKMFKLIIRPVTSNTFYINTLDGYYGDGNLLDISDYVDLKDVIVERPTIYKNIIFKYQKSNNFPAVKFRELNDPANLEIGYGDLKSVQPYVETKEELKVELPFENMPFERMIRLSTTNFGEKTNIQIGQSIQSSDDGLTFTKNNSKPILFFNNGIANNTASLFRTSFKGTNISVAYNYLIGTTDDELTSQIRNTLNFNAEIDPWHGITVFNSLFQNYWKNWIDTIYSLKQRKFKFDATLPPRYVEELSLNDRLIIGDQRYKINDYTINLSNGKAKLNLILDIFDSYSTNNVEFNGSTFSFTRLTDFTNANADGSYFLYGNITSYNGLTSSHLIKLRKNGQQDTNFNSLLGGPNVAPSNNMRLYKYADDSLLVAGSYSTYNGVNRSGVTRLFPNGLVDTSLVAGSFGSFGYTTKVDVQSDDKILVAGLFSSYNSTTSNNLVRMSSTGSYDSSFNVGTGFNNAVTDFVRNEDNTLYVTGLFTTYKGTTFNGLTRITSTASIGVTFSSGAGIVPSTSRNSLLQTFNDNNSVYLIGSSMTSYKGVTAGRIIKIKSDGNQDMFFNVGTGVTTGSLNYIRYTANNDKIFLSGTFSSFNGITSSNAIILRKDGLIEQVFNNHNCDNLYNVGDDVYGIDKTTKLLKKLTSDTSLITYQSYIQANAGAKYYGIDISSDTDWEVSLVNLGFGTSWVTLLTPSGSGSSQIQIYIGEKTSQIPPEVLLDRRLAVKIKAGNIEKLVSIRQTGL